MMLISPHGGTFKENLLPAEEVQAQKLKAKDFLSWDLTKRQLSDIEMLLNGGYSPLNGFMGKADYEEVTQNMRLSGGTLWPIPITLDVTDSFAKSVSKGDNVALRDPEGVLIAIINVTDSWTPDKKKEARLVYGTQETAHPGVDYLLNKANPVYIGGDVSGVELPTNYDFKHLRHSPRELRERFRKLGWRRVVAFHTGSSMHRAHHEITFRAGRLAEANLLIHPVVGESEPSDGRYYSRVRSYEHILKKYPEQTTALSLLPLAARLAGPREAVWHAIVRKNYGCTHLIIGKDHGSPDNDGNGQNFYGPYDAQKLVAKYQDELVIEMVPFKTLVYVQEKAEYVTADSVEKGQTTNDISDEEFRRRLQEDLPVPEWFSYKEVVDELRRAHPPRHKQGFTIFFTGLPSSGKSTAANALMVKLMEIGGRATTLLDGDVVRKNLSSELGFSREHRDLNILRIGYVASEITKNGGIAICAPIAPYSATRKKVKEMISAVGGFLEVYVSTPIEVCETRDRKGLYAKARQGIIKEFTGVSDPYEVPESPALVIDTRDTLPEEAVQSIILRLEKEGYIR